MAGPLPVTKELERASRRGFITNLEGGRRGFVTNYPNVSQWRLLRQDEVVHPRPLHLYVHIPFCAQQCSYCYYRVITGAGKSEMERYTGALCKEIGLAVDRYGLGNRPVQTIYFGGGTPTILPSGELQRITGCIRDHFAVAPGAEFTIEGEPVTMTAKKTDAFADLPIPVSRISMGAQSFDDGVVRTNGRKDTAERVLAAIAIARDTGAVVNIDLMSGLAGDTPESWRRTIDEALGTGVESITVYKTEVYANSEYYKQLRRNAVDLPDDDEEIAAMDYALDAFERADYSPWCFFTFTRNGAFPHRHAARVWQGEDCLPIGTSAFGKLGDQLFQNTNDPEKYMRTVEANALAVNRGHRLSAKDKMIRAALLGMKLMRLDLDGFAMDFGFRLERLCAPVFDALQSDGFVTLDDPDRPRVLAMTRRGVLHGDYVGKQLGRALQRLG